ncbi:MAG: hypothetical protein V4563_02910 [Pseudomonadota bacterium]
MITLAPWIPERKSKYAVQAGVLFRLFSYVRDRTESPFFFQQYALSSLVKKEIS